MQTSLEQEVTELTKTGAENEGSTQADQLVRSQHFTLSSGLRTTASGEFTDFEQEVTELTKTGAENEG